MTNLQNELEDANEKLQRIREEKSQKIENLHKFSKSTEINGIEESLFQKNSRDVSYFFQKKFQNFCNLERLYFYSVANFLTLFFRIFLEFL